MAAQSAYATQLANGGSVVVWDSGDPVHTVYAQILDANGAKTGAPISVFSGQSVNGWSARGVAALPDGSFLIAAKGEIDSATRLYTSLQVQKLSASGEPLSRTPVLSQSQSEVIDYIDVHFFVNPDSSYALSAVSFGHPVPTSNMTRWIATVDASGNVVGSPVNVSDGYVYYAAPVAARLGNGNFLVAGTSTITYGPVVWKVVTPTGAVVAQQSLGAAPGNSTSDAQVATLADGTGLLTWRFANSTTTGWAAERIDGNGNVITGQTAPTRAGSITGLAHGGYMQTWLEGTQAMAQYFTSAGAPVGDPFVAASAAAWFTIAPTADGFLITYATPAAEGSKLYETRFTAPPMS